MSFNNGAHQSPQLIAARLYQSRGLTTIPVRSDGSKKQSLPTWKQYQTTRPTDSELRQWFAETKHGLAILGGKASGNLLIVDFDEFEIFERWRPLAEAVINAAGLSFANVPLVKSPRPGVHVYLRCSEPVNGNEKLACRPATAAELERKPDDKIKTLIETRGEGGYVVAPGSPADCHISQKEYAFLNRGWLDDNEIQLIPTQLLTDLLTLARALDQMPIQEQRPPAQHLPCQQSDGPRPGDCFNSVADWRFVLGDGTRFSGGRGGVEYVTRPGKDHGVSGTIGFRKNKDGVPLLVVFSTSWSPFEATSATRPTGYTPFHAYALLHHGGKFDDAAKKLAELGYGSPPRGQYLQQQSTNGNQLDPNPTPERGDAWEPTLEPAANSKPNAGATVIWKPKPIDSTAFAHGDYRHEWLVTRLLVTKEPAIVFGPSKTLKTSFVVDLAISLACGLMALGFFFVPRKIRVLIISGESGPASLQSTARRICDARGIDLAALGDWLQWEFSLPPLSDPRALSILHTLLADRKFDVVIIDPAYLALLTGGDLSADKASNLFAMGPLLCGLVNACSSAGSQLLLVHHCNARINIGETPDLSHLAYAGFQQFARQWIGLNRSVAYQHDGKHSMIVVAGGSAGHGGKWMATIDEGNLGDDFAGRKWDVEIEEFAQAAARQREEKTDAREQMRVDRNSQDEQKLMAIIDATAAAGEIASRTRLRDASGLSRERADGALERLRQQRLIMEYADSAQVGNGASRQVMAYRRKVGTS